MGVFVGITLYLIWSQSREDINSNGDFRFGKSMNNLFGVRPDNIFMLKLVIGYKSRVAASRNRGSYKLAIINLIKSSFYSKRNYHFVFINVHYI